MEGKTITPEVRAKLRKILALAEKGEAGEQATAKRMLEQLLKAYDLTMEDIIEQEQVRKFVFNNISNKLLQKIWSHCVFRVMNVNSITYWIGEKRTDRVLECTQSQVHQIADLFKWHRENFEKELEQAHEDLLHAYVLKHHLYSEHKDDESTEDYQPIDIERIRRIMMYEMNLKDNSYYKSLQQ